MLEFILYSSGGVSPPTDFSKYRWSVVPGPETTFIHNVGAYHNGYLYSMGGFASGTSRPDLYRLSTNGSIASMASAPNGRAGHSLISHNGYLYAIGGMGSNTSSFVTLNQRYDILNNRWDNMAPLPAACCWMDACLINEDIYIIGGSLSPTAIETPNRLVGYKYNIPGDVWSEITIPDIPPRLVCGVAAIGTDIYIHGGRYNSVYKSDFYKYDTLTGDVTTLASTTVAQGTRQNIFAPDDTQIIILCGVVQGGMSRSTLRYDIANNTWSELSTSTDSRVYSANSYGSQAFWQFGGYNGVSGVMRNLVKFSP